jgi:putative spermidine/putrescine transport system ATP-binding protein
MSFLELRNLQCRYGRTVAVEDVSLQVERGEFVSLLGPSGCGKTTTLQMIAGFVEPTGGSVFIDGSELGRVAPNRRGVGIVFQSYALFPHMTVAGNVAFGLEMRHVARPQREQRVARALAQVHLSHLAPRYPRQLSGGQQQRVAIARALVIEPRLLLLDEPMSNLDAKLREDMQFELRRLQRELAITTVMVTHDQNEAMAMSDRIAVMRSGRIVQVDTPQSAYEHPADDFASNFLGKSNNVAGQARNGVIDLPGDVRIQAHTNLDGAVLCSVRPEKLRVTDAGYGKLTGTIRSRMFLGNHWLIQVESGMGDLLVYQQNTGAAPPEEGQVVGLDWHPDSLRVLPANGADG